MRGNHNARGREFAEKNQQSRGTHVPTKNPAVESCCNDGIAAGPNRNPLSPRQSRSAGGGGGGGGGADALIMVCPAGEFTNLQTSFTALLSSTVDVP